MSLFCFALLCVQESSVIILLSVLVYTLMYILPIVCGSSVFVFVLFCTTLCPRELSNNTFISVGLYFNVYTSNCLWEFCVCLCFVLHYFLSILVLQSS